MTFAHACVFGVGMMVGIVMGALALLLASVLWDRGRE